MARFSRNSSRKPHAFTLTELLTVVAVLTLLIALVAPTFGTLTRNAHRRAAVGETLALLERARSAALASGRAAYVAFADQSAPEDRRFRSACVFVDREDLSLPPEPVTSWMTLPTGLSFHRTGGSFLNMEPEAASPVFSLPDDPGGSRALPYLKFAPTGAVLHPGLTPAARLELFHGYTGEDGTQVRTGQATQPPEVITLSRFTGCARYEP